MKHLEVKNLTVEFKSPEGILRAVDGVSFVLEQGKILGLVGESGCGKSVTAFSLLKLVEPPGKIVKGEVLLYPKEQRPTLEGEMSAPLNLLNLSEKELCQIRGKRIAIIFQEPMTSLNPVLRVGDQVVEALLAHGTLSQKEAFEKALELFIQVGLAEPKRCLQDYPHQLSGGMRQRVMIAMALACEPEILIADEPTTALDVTLQAQILELLCQLTSKRKMTLLLITHDLGIVAQTCDTVGVMYAGKIVEFSPASRFFSGPKHPYSLGLLSAIPSLEDPVRKFNPIPGTVPSLNHLPTGCRFQPRCFKALPACGLKVTPLKYTGAGHWVRCINT